MPTINFHNKKFGLLHNSKEGIASDETIFYYQQDGDLVTADYKGGSIKCGKIIARQLPNNDLEMLYQCITLESELRAGKAYAKTTLNANGKIQLNLDWSWISGGDGAGTSTYVEL